VSLVSELPLLSSLAPPTSSSALSRPCRRRRYRWHCPAPAPCPCPCCRCRHHHCQCWHRPYVVVGTVPTPAPAQNSRAQEFKIKLNILTLIIVGIVGSTLVIIPCRGHGRSTLQFPDLVVRPLAFHFCHRRRHHQFFLLMIMPSFPSPLSIIPSGAVAG
jgi:hypothetical protein